jgi:hypothetical protein
MKPLSTATFTKTLGLKHQDRLGQEESKKVREQALEFVDSFARQPDVEVVSSSNGYVFSRSTDAQLERLYVSKGWVSDGNVVLDRDAMVEFTTSKIKDGQPFRSKQFTINFEAKSQIEAIDFDSEGKFKKQVTLFPPNASGSSVFHARTPKPTPVKQFEIPDYHHEALEAEVASRDKVKMYHSYLSQRHLLPPIPDPGRSGE